MRAWFTERSSRSTSSRSSARIARRPASWSRAAVAAGSAPAASWTSRRAIRPAVPACRWSRSSAQAVPGNCDEGGSGSRVDAISRSRPGPTRSRAVWSPVTGRGDPNEGELTNCRTRVASATSPRTAASTASARWAGSSGSRWRAWRVAGETGRDRSAPRAARRPGKGREPWISWIPASSRRSVSASQGLRRYRWATESARVMDDESDQPESRTRAVAGQRSRTCPRKSTPSTPGILRSLTTTSAGSRAISSSAVAAPLAMRVDQRRRSRRSTCCNPRTTDSSSSTRRIRKSGAELMLPPGRRESGSGRWCPFRARTRR